MHCEDDAKMASRVEEILSQIILSDGDCRKAVELCCAIKNVPLRGKLKDKIFIEGLHAEAFYECLGISIQPEVREMMRHNDVFRLDKLREENLKIVSEAAS